MFLIVLEKGRGFVVLGRQSGDRRAIILGQLVPCHHVIIRDTEQGANLPNRAFSRAIVNEVVYTTD